MNKKKLFTYYFFLIFIFLPHSIKSQSIDSLGFNITRLPFNLTSADFSPAFFKSGIVFCSNRDNNLGVVYTDEDTEEPLADLYFTEKLIEKWKKPTPLSSKINSFMSEGQASFNKNFDKIYFSKVYMANNRARFGIYSAILENNKWGQISAFPFNNDKYSISQPSLSPSESFIIFVSDMPGGFGGTDLYMSYFREGKWSKPQNLGRSVNTSRNEISPFIHENGLLYFASDGHKGAGGFDIYSVYYNQFEWKGLKNIGYPFNTQFNDFGFIIDNDLKNGYFTSNRLNGRNDDDIYAFSKGEVQFKNCDSLKHLNLCRTFFEESAVTTTENLPLVYEWNLGEGTKKRGNEIRHCFPKPGIYTIQLNIVDLISNQVYLNEATYELEIEPIKSAYFEIWDTLLSKKEYFFDASKSNIPGFKIKEYAWDFGTGEVTKVKAPRHQFNVPGNYDIKLNITAIDSLMEEKNFCVTKTSTVIDHVKEKTNMDDGSHLKEQISKSAKTIYSIKDSEGNEYKIQLATSKTSIKKEFKKFEGFIDVEEYFDREVYGYTTGNFLNPSEAFYTLKKIKRLGFKEAVLIAMKNGKVISGNDSSFFIDIKNGLVPVKSIFLKGRVTDAQGKNIPATIKWENLDTGEQLGEFVCESPVGEFNIDLIDGDLYGYHAYYPGYFPSSNHIDLRLDNEILEINGDIILYNAQQLAKNNISLRINNLFFPPEKYEVQPESYSELERLAAFIKENPDYRFEIAGHSDHSGGEQYNFTLSQKRANSVLSYLLKLGCPGDNLTARGYGNTKPLTTNKKLAELNRRVEFKVINKN